MFLDTQEKEFIKKLVDEKDISTKQFIEKFFEGNSNLTSQAFEVKRGRGRNNYSVQVEVNDKEEAESALTNEFIFQLSRFVKLVTQLESNDYIAVTKIDVPKGNPLLAIGEASDNPTFKTIEDEEVISKIAYLLDSKIRPTERLSNLVANNFLTESEINLQRSIKLAETSSKNSNRILAANIVGLLFSIAAIGFAIFTFHSSQKASNDTISNLKAISESSSEVAEKINLLPSKIQTFSTSIDSFSSSVGRYQNYIDDYSGQLERIVSLTEVQLKIWKDQQKIVRDEYSRRSKLKIQINKCNMNNGKMELKGFIIKNEGDIEATIEDMLVSFDNSRYKLSKKHNIFFKNNKKQGLSTYQLYNTQSGGETIINGQAISLDFPLQEISKGSSSIKVQLAYKSKYKSETLFEYINLKNCKGKFKAVQNQANHP